MDITAEVAKAIVGALKLVRPDGDLDLIWRSLSEPDRVRYLGAARDAIETYLAIVAMPLEVRDEL